MTDAAERIERIALALERIAAVLDAAMPAGESAPVPPSLECLHPAELRADFGVTDGVDDWLCKVCGFRTVNP